MLNKILITDPLSKNGLKILQDNGFDVLYKPELADDELSAIISNIEGWIIRSGTTITKEHIKDAKKLQIIGRAGVGTDNIDIKAATQEGVVVMNVPDGNTISAAEHTMAMLLSLSRNDGMFFSYITYICMTWHIKVNTIRKTHKNTTVTLRG